MARTPSIPYRHDIDGLRAIAVVLVVLYHAELPGISGGYVGVDVFFVISGFLITSVIVAQAETGRFSVVGFYAGRVRRLLPLSLLTLTTTVLIGAWLLPSARATELVGDARSALFYFANWRFADKSVAYVDTEVSEGLLTHYWSLAIEEQFYLVWPLALVGAIVAVRRVPKIRLRTVVAALAFTVTVVSLAMSIRITGTQGARAYYLTHLRLWEISTGALIAVSIGRVGLGTRTRSIVQSASISAILFSAFWFDDLTPFPGSAALIPVVAAALLVAVGGGNTPVDALLGSAPMRYVGERSFAWYLWHWPALGIAELLGGRFDLGWNEITQVGSAIAVSFVLAVVTHRAVENPIRFASLFRRLPRTSIIVGGACTLALFVGTAVTQTQITRASAQVWGDARMTPEQALADVASVDFGLCQRSQAQGPAGEVAVWCEAGDPEGSQTIVLVGDSHAQHWAPAFDTAGIANGWRVIITTRSSCLVYDIPTYNARLELMDDSCRKWTTSVHEAIAAEPNVDLVVVGRARGYFQTIRAEDGSIPSDEELSNNLQAAAREFLDATLGQAGSVMIIEDTPWAPYIVPDCLSTTTPLDSASCDFEATTTDLELPLLAAEQSAVDATPSQHDEVVSLDDLACPGGQCRAVNPDGLITYRDRHHLTSTFSRYLADDLGRILSGLLSGPR